MRELFLCATFLLCVINTKAQIKAGENFTLGGYAQLDHISFFKELENSINSRNQTSLDIDIEADIGQNYSLFSSLEFRNDLSDHSRDRFFMQELYVDFFSKNIDFRVGKQRLTWGKADGFNPINVFGVTDYTDVLDTEDEKPGIFALSGKLFMKDWEIQLVYSPIFTPSTLPTSNSRWMPENIQIQDDTYQAIYHIAEIKPQDRFRNMQFGAKISKSSGFIDFSVACFSGYNHIPTMSQTLDSISFNDKTASINVLRKYYKHHVIGGDFSFQIQKYIIKGEGALFIPEDIAVDNPYFQYVIGFDRTFSNVISDKNLSLIFQWMHEIKSKNVEYSGQDFNHLFQRNLMCRMELTFNYSLNISLQGIYALKYEDFYIRPELNYNISDGLNFTLLADLLNGNKDKGGLFSGYTDNSRIQAKLRFNF